jgi:hypothetical protein
LNGINVFRIHPGITKPCFLFGCLKILLRKRLAWSLFVWCSSLMLMIKWNRMGSTGLGDRLEADNVVWKQ